MRRFVLKRRAYDPIARRMREPGEIIALPERSVRLYRAKLGEEVTDEPETAVAPELEAAEKAVKPRKRRSKGDSRGGPA